MHGQNENGRRGFTLIEMLVVIAIISFLGAMAYFISGALFRSDKAQRGGAQVQGTLSIAKQMALRDRVVYGVRLVRDANPSPNYASPNPLNPLLYDYIGLEYIQQPPDYVQNAYRAGPAPSVMPPIPPWLIEMQRPLDGGLGPAAAFTTDPTPVPVPVQKLWPVQVGDVLKIDNKRDPFLITGIYTRQDPNNAMNLQWFVRVGSDPLIPSPAPPIPAPWLNNFRIMRAARTVPGEEMIKLPEDIVIDGVFSKYGTSANATLGVQSTPPPPIVVIPSVIPDPVTERVDILFAPGRAVVGPAAQSGKIILWVRARQAVPMIRATDGAIIAHQSKEQMLVVIFTRTGLIATYPVDNSYAPDPNIGNLPNPYRFASDNRATGL